MGVDGVVTVSGNVVHGNSASKAVSGWRPLAMTCRRCSATLDATLQRLNKALFVESNPIPVKWAVSQMGLMESHIRLPLTPYDDQYHDEMRAAMREAGVTVEGSA